MLGAGKRAAAAQQPEASSAEPLWKRETLVEPFRLEAQKVTVAGVEEAVNEKLRQIIVH